MAGIYDAIRQIARVDNALAHLVGFQCLQVVSVDVWGNAAQRRRYLRGTVEQQWWWGNAVNPLDTRLVVGATPDGGYRLDGVKGFCSGTRGSQRMTVSRTIRTPAAPCSAWCRPIARGSRSAKTGIRSASARPTAAACASTA